MPECSTAKQRTIETAVEDCIWRCWVLVKCNWCWHYTLLAPTTAHFCPWAAGTVGVPVGEIVLWVCQWERVCAVVVHTEKGFGDEWLVATRLWVPVVYRNWSNVLLDTPELELLCQCCHSSQVVKRSTMILAGTGEWSTLSETHINPLESGQNHVLYANGISKSCPVC